MSAATIKLDQAFLVHRRSSLDALAHRLLTLTNNHLPARGFPDNRPPTLEYLLAAVGEGFRSPTPLFDPVHYLSHLPPAIRRETSPLRHYLETGASLGIAPAAIVDLGVLDAAAEPDAEEAPAETPALIRLLENAAPPFLCPNILFDAEVYLAHLPAGALDGLSPFEHFLLYWTEHRVPFSRVFDHEFYFLMNRHIDAARINPLRHYFSLPVDQRTDANPMIHNKYYALTHPGVRGDPLVHYVRFGLGQGAAPNPYAFRELRIEPTQLPAEHVRDRLLGYIARAA